MFIQSQEPIGTLPTQLGQTWHIPFDGLGREAVGWHLFSVGMGQCHEIWGRCTSQHSVLMIFGMLQASNGLNRLGAP